MSTLGWLASVVSGVFVVTTLVETMINVTNADFAFPNWQYTLIMLAFLVLTIFLNTWGATALPMLETVSLFGHIGGFIIVLVSLWVLAPKNTAHAVFVEVTNNGGWSNTGTSCLVAQVTVLYCNLGGTIDSGSFSRDVSVADLCFQVLIVLSISVGLKRKAHRRSTNTLFSRRGRGRLSGRTTMHVVELHAQCIHGNYHTHYHVVLYRGPQLCYRVYCPIPGPLQ